MSDPFSNFEEYESDLGLDDEDRKQAKSGADVEWYKPQDKGKTDRVAIVYFHPLEVTTIARLKKENPSVSKDDLVKAAQAALAKRASELNKTVDQLTKVDKLDLSQVHFKKMVSHYQDDLGFVLTRLGKDGSAADEVWKKLPEAKTHFSTLLLIYPTNRDGTLDKERFAKDWTLKPWRFSPKRYDSIWKVNNTLKLNNFSIANQDLLLECKDPKYQQIEPSGAGPALWSKNATFREAVLDKAVGLYDKLVPFRTMTTEQLKDKLGLGGSGSVQDVTANSDFSDLLAGV